MISSLQIAGQATCFATACAMRVFPDPGGPLTTISVGVRISVSAMPRDAFVFHPAHNHWHLVGVNGFEVRKALDDGQSGNWDRKKTVGASVKESFCLLDYVKLDNDQLASFGITLPSREYYDCFGTHGISSGWIDYYHHSTHGQYVDITGASAGLYYLVLTANPDGHFIEESYANNRAWISFSLTYNRTNNAIATPLYNSVDQVGEGVRPPSNTNK